ncbi:MAG: hypothetical protein MIO90_05935 [Methanomassiliicoccales archaeon]|nr:hypothetical protein [Methanomassiliicoccales archaeon]
MSKVLLTMMGRSVWGLFNSVWASIRHFDFLPDQVYVLTVGCEDSRANVAKEMLIILLREHGSQAKVDLVSVPGDDIKEIGRVSGEILVREKGLGNEVAVDVTPGTKATVLGTVLGSGKVKVDHIFYLYIESLQNASRPYLEIPLELQHSHDLLQEIR